MSFQLLNLSEILSKSLYVKNIVILDKVDSTNQYLIDNISYLKSGFVCLAECQTHGRGRYGKNWYSPCGNNIYLSMYWFFLKDRRDLIALLSLVISVVIGEVLEKLGVKGITFKWPNDIYVNSGKLGGVLVEIVSKFNDYLHVIIGIGINITLLVDNFMDGIEIISLETMGIFINRNILVANIINALYKFLIEFSKCGFLSFFSRWIFLDKFYNRPVKLLVRNRMILGISRGISSSGLLLLEYSGSVYSYSSMDGSFFCDDQ